MKVIKIILGIIITLSVVFFATGLVVKETKYSSEIVVDKPIKEVFTKFNDVETFKEWLPDIKSIETINENPQKIGSTYKMIVDNQGQGLEIIEEIVAYVSNEKITLRFTSDEMLKIDDYNFIAQENQTKIVQNSTISSKSYMLACTFPWFKSKFKVMSQNYMVRFKQFVEKPTSILPKGGSDNNTK